MPSLPQVRDSTGVDRSVTQGTSTGNGIVVRINTGVDYPVTRGHVRNSVGVDTLFYERRMSNIILDASGWKIPFGVDNGTAIETNSWTWGGGGGTTTPVSEGLNVTWYAIAGSRTGLLMRSNSPLNLTGYTKVCVQYKKVNNGYYITGSPSDGSYQNGTIAITSALAYPNSQTPAPYFVSTGLNKTMNATTWIVLNIPNGVTGHLWFSFFSTDGASGAIVIQKIYLE